MTRTRGRPAHTRSIGPTDSNVVVAKLSKPEGCSSSPARGRSSAIRPWFETHDERMVSPSSRSGTHRRNGDQVGLREARLEPAARRVWRTRSPCSLRRPGAMSRGDRVAFVRVGLLPSPYLVQFGLEGGPVDGRGQGHVATFTLSAAKPAGCQGRQRRIVCLTRGGKCIEVLPDSLVVVWSLKPATRCQRANAAMA
jgi:hypothetical protein